jgi:hypothetical protein
MKTVQQYYAFETGTGRSIGYGTDNWGVLGHTNLRTKT